MVGMGSSIYVASQAFDEDVSTPLEIAQADDTLAQVMRDSQAATNISELTATAATFTVPDRDGDGDEETIRYAWSGTAGDPLTYQYNGGTVENLAEDVQHFELTYLSRFIEGATEKANLIYVASELKDLTKNETREIEQIESWGITVTVLTQYEDEEVFTKYASINNVVYVSGETSAKVLSSKLSSLTIGVVSEQFEQYSTLGFATDDDYEDEEAIRIFDNSHYITDGFDTEDLKVMSKEQELGHLDDSWSPDVIVLAGFDKDEPALVVLEAGATSVSGRAVSGRRVLLPWGTNGFDFKQITPNGLTIMQRSIEWAATGAKKETPILFPFPIKPSTPIILTPDDWFGEWLR